MERLTCPLLALVKLLTELLVPLLVELPEVLVLAELPEVLVLPEVAELWEDPLVLPSVGQQWEGVLWKGLLQWKGLFQ